MFNNTMNNNIIEDRMTASGYMSYECVTMIRQIKSEIKSIELGFEYATKEKQETNKIYLKLWEDRLYDRDTSWHEVWLEEKRMINSDRITKSGYDVSICERYIQIWKKDVEFMEEMGVCTLPNVLNFRYDNAKEQLRLWEDRLNNRDTSWYDNKHK